MIINWSSPSSQAVTHLVSAIYNPNTTTCALMRLVRQGQMITDFEELKLDKMLFGLIDIRQHGLNSYQRHKKAVYHAITAYFAPSLPPYQILTHNIRGS